MINSAYIALALGPSVARPHRIIATIGGIGTLVALLLVAAGSMASLAVMGAATALAIGAAYLASSR